MAKISREKAAGSPGRQAPSGAWSPDALLSGVRLDTGDIVPAVRFLDGFGIRQRMTGSADTGLRRRLDPVRIGAIGNRGLLKSCR